MRMQDPHYMRCNLAECKEEEIVILRSVFEVGCQKK